MSDSPRYRIINTDGFELERDVKRALRPGDRIVAVFPRYTSMPEIGLCLSVIIELRHPSWALEGVGWAAGEER